MAKRSKKAATSITQVRIGGVGGQGIVLAGRLLGQAAALYDGKEAVCTQSYGPEARGGASRSDVVISNKPVDYPYVMKADILAVLFQEAYIRFRDRIAPGGLLLVDTGLVKPAKDEKNVSGLPATQMAKDLGSRVVANIVMLGFLIEKTGVVSRESLEQAIRTSVKKQHVELDLKALDAGISYARSEAAA